MCRLLTEGDTFAAALEDATGRSNLLRALHCPDEPAAPAAAGLGYFKVVAMEPRTGASLLIDCKHTAVMLEVRNAPCLASHALESGQVEAAQISTHWQCLHRTRRCHVDNASGTSPFSGVCLLGSSQEYMPLV